MPLSPLVRRYDQLILDLDGCIYVGDVPVPGAVEAVEAAAEHERRAEQPPGPLRFAVAAV